MKTPKERRRNKGIHSPGSAIQHGFKQVVFLIASARDRPLPLKQSRRLFCKYKSGHTVKFLGFKAKQDKNPSPTQSGKALPHRWNREDYFAPFVLGAAPYCFKFPGYNVKMVKPRILQYMVQQDRFACRVSVSTVLTERQKRSLDLKYPF